jgi:hypothetical protein
MRLTQTRGRFLCVLATTILVLAAGAILTTHAQSSSAPSNFAAGDGALPAMLDVLAPTAKLGFKRTDDATGTNPQSIVVADFNGDGKLDLALVNYSGGGSGLVSVLLGKGDGTFQKHADYPVGAGPDGIAVADFNGDGKLDLAVANDVGSSISVLFGNGDGTFQAHQDYAAGSFPHWIAVGDFNGDGKPDLVITNEGGASVGVFVNKGDGTFKPMATFGTSGEPYSVAVADFNHDGKADLAVTGYLGSVVSILLGKGNGTFATHVDYPCGTAPAVVVARDINADGKVDLITANYSNGQTGSVSVLLGKGDGTFGSQLDFEVGTGPDGLAVGDFNGDGIPDLAVANLIGNTMSILLGNGNGTFQTHVDFATGVFPLGVAVGEFNGEGPGSENLAITNDLSAFVSIFLNQAATQMTLASSPNPSKEGQAVTFTVGVKAALKSKAGPTGTVTFRDGSKKLATVKLAAGTAQFTTSTLTAGKHKVTARYSGDGNFNPNTSAPVVQRVQR